MELIFDTKTYKGLNNKNATIETNDTSQAKPAIDFRVNIIEGPDTTSAVRWSPDRLNFSLNGGKQTVMVKNHGTAMIRLTLAGAARDDMKVAIGNEQIAPGATSSINFTWSGGTLKQGIKHVATFATSDPSVPRFSIPYVVEGTQPFPAEPKPAVVTPPAQPTKTNHDHSKSDTTGSSPIKTTPDVASDGAKSVQFSKPTATGPRVAADSAVAPSVNPPPKWPLSPLSLPRTLPPTVPAPTATTSTASGMNPPHGQPNHRCDIPVGSPLSSPPGTGTTITPSQPNAPAPTTATATAPGMNPPHGQPNHRCDISVGSPLSSPVPKAEIKKPESSKPKIKPVTPAPKSDSTGKKE